MFDHVDFVLGFYVGDVGAGEPRGDFLGGFLNCSLFLLGRPADFRRGCCLTYFVSDHFIIIQLINSDLWLSLIHI